MTIIEIKEKSLWDNIFNQAGSPSFLQTWEWGEFQKSLDYPVIRLAIKNKNKIEAIFQVIKIKAKRGSFLFIPHGPIKIEKSNLENQDIIKNLLDYLVNIGRKENFSFIRVAPIWENNQRDQKIFKNLGFKMAPIYLHAETTWQLSLKTDEQTLLKGMRKTTRYLIKKAARDEVVVEKRTDNKAIDDFYQIYEKTAKREHFHPFSKEYIKKEFEAFKQSNNALFFFGRQKNSPHYLASSLIIFTQSTAFYHQGASIHTKVPVSYLIQWEAILEAKKRGCQFYNFWGILKKDRTPKNWQGLTLFKTGFGGFQIDYLPNQDYLISPKYYLTYLYEKFLAWRRGV